MICHVESGYWMISECVDFAIWYLGELRYCVTRESQNEGGDC
jgi:hypothetical protein